MSCGSGFRSWRVRQRLSGVLFRGSKIGFKNQHRLMDCQWSYPCFRLAVWKYYASRHASQLATIRRLQQRTQDMCYNSSDDVGQELVHHSIRSAKWIPHLVIQYDLQINRIRKGGNFVLTFHISPIAASSLSTCLFLTLKRSRTAPCGIYILRISRSDNIFYDFHAAQTALFYEVYPCMSVYRIITGNYG